MTTTKTLREIPNADERRRYLELERQFDALGDEKYEASRALRLAKSAATEPLWEEFRPKIKAIEADFDAKIEAAEAALSARQEALSDEMDKLIKVIGCGPRRFDFAAESNTECDLTGLPVFDKDDIIEDENTGQCILRDVLPWPEAKEAGE